MSDDNPNASAQDAGFSDIVDSATQGSLPDSVPAKCNVWGRHGGYYLALAIRGFFLGPPRPSIPKSKNSRFKFVAEQLISTLPDNDADPIITGTSEKLLEQHRTIENTEARRRLEKWACRTIILYLISVFALLVLNGLSRVLWPDVFKESGFISDTVMYVILSTTTVNVIGLGLIVLRGHFQSNEGNQHKTGG